MYTERIILLKYLKI